MDADLMKISSIGSVGSTADLSRVPAEIAGKDDFEFTFASIKSDPNTNFLPVYPIFSASFVDGGLDSPEEEKQDQLLGFRSSSSLISSNAKKLDEICSTVSSDYCVLKSNSTGSRVLESGKLKLRDIVFGRSHSEGDKLLLDPMLREKKMEKSCFSLFRFRDKSEAEKKGKKGKENRRGVAGGGQMPAVSLRRSFLPYRQELLSGFFYCSSRRNGF